MTSGVYPRRGEVYLADFDPARGAEIKKVRPAVVIQNDAANRASRMTIVVPVSTTVPEILYPTQVLIPTGEGGLHADSAVVLKSDQVD